MLGQLRIARFSCSPLFWVVTVGSTCSLYKSVFQVCLKWLSFSSDSHHPDLGPWATPPPGSLPWLPMPTLPIKSGGSPQLICPQSILGYSHVMSASSFLVSASHRLLSYAREFIAAGGSISFHQQDVCKHGRSRGHLQGAHSASRLSSPAQHCSLPGRLLPLTFLRVTSLHPSSRVGPKTSDKQHCLNQP